MRPLALTLLFCSAALAADQNILRIIPTPTLSSQGQLRFMASDNALTAKYFSIQASPTMTAIVKIQLPDNVPNVGDCMTAGALTGGVYPMSFGGCGAGVTFPVTDLNPHFKNDTDPTRLLRIDVSGVSTGTTRVWTAQDANIIVAGTNVDNNFSTNESFYSGNIRFYRSTEFIPQSIEFNSLATPVSGNWKLGVQNSVAFPGADTSFALKYQGNTLLLVEDSGDVTVSRLEATTAIGTPSVNTNSLIVGQIRTNDFASLVIFDTATRDLTNIHNITFSGTLNGLINIQNSDLTLTRATEFTSQNIKYANLASGTSGNWFAGVGNSIQFPGADSAYFIKQQAVNKLVIEGSGDITAFGTFSANAINSPSSNVTTSLFSKLQGNDFSAFIYLDIANNNLQHINNLSMGGTITGPTSISTGNLIISGTCTGTACGATLAGNNTWTGIQTINTNDFILNRATLTTAQSIKYQNQASGAVGNWFWGVGNSLAFPGTSSAMFLKLQAVNKLVIEDSGDVTTFGTFQANALNATTSSVTNSLFSKLQGNDFSAFVYLDIANNNLQHINNLSMGGTITGPTSITTNNLIVTGTCTGCGSAGALLSSNNTWTGTNTFNNDLTVGVGHDLTADHIAATSAGITTLTANSILTGFFATFLDTSQNIFFHNATLTGNIVGNLGINSTDFSSFTSLAGSKGIVVKGTTERGHIDFQSGSGDGNGNRIGAYTFTDITSTNSDKRVATATVILDGSTTNNRGGTMTFFTRQDGTAGLQQRFQITHNGLVYSSAPIVPFADITYDLGTPPLRWRKLYVKDIAVTGTCTGCSTGGSELTTEQFNAFCDGTSHPLSATFATLAAAQAFYSFVGSTNVSNASMTLSDETDWAAIQHAIGYLKVNGAFGGKVKVQRGICFVNKTIDIGDGASSGNSTYQGITLQGQGSGKTRPGERQAATIIQYTGGVSTSSALVRENGPIGGVFIKDILLDCDNKCGINIDVQHLFNGGADSVILHKPLAWGMRLQAYQNFPTGAGNNNNLWRQVNIKSIETCTAGGVQVGNQSVSGGGILAVSRNDFYELDVVGNPIICPSGAGTAVELSYTDSEAFYNVYTLNMSKSVVVKPPTGSSLFPQQIAFYNTYLGVTPTLDTSLNSWSPTSNNSGLLFENYVQDGGGPAFPTFAGIRGTTNAQWVYGQKTFTALGTNNFGSNTSALIVQNYTLGANGSAIEFQATNTSTTNTSTWPSTPNNIFPVGRVFGVMDANSVARNRLSVQIWDGSNFNNILNVTGFKVGIGIINPNFTLDVVGTTNSTNMQTTGLLVTAGTGTEPLMEIRGDVANAQYVATSYNGVPALVGRYAEGSVASPTQLPINRQMFAVGARGYVPPANGGTGFTTSASSVMQFFSGEAWTGTANGSYITFATTPSTGSTTARSTKMTINGAIDYQTVQTVGGVYALLYLTTDQFLNMKGFVSAPGTVPGGGYGGLTYRGGSQYWYYNGSSWQTVDFAGSGSALLSSNNTWTGTNTFNNNIVMGGSFSLSGGSSLSATTVSGTTGIFNSIQRGFFNFLDASGNISNVGTLTMSGLLSAGGQIKGLNSIVLRDSSDTYNKVLISSQSTSGLISVNDGSGSQRVTLSGFDGIARAAGFGILGGSSGITQTLSVRNAAGTGACLITVTGGIITSSSC